MYVEAAAVEAAEGKGSLRTTGAHQGMLCGVGYDNKGLGSCHGGPTGCTLEQLLWRLPRGVFVVLCIMQLAGPVSRVTGMLEHAIAVLYGKAARVIM